MGLTIGPRPECYTFLCTSQHTRTVHRVQGWYIEYKYHNIDNYDTKDGNKAYIATLYWARSKYHAEDTCPINTSYIAETNSLSTDKNQIGLRVQKINIRVHNQQATGCCLRNDPATQRSRRPRTWQSSLLHTAHHLSYLFIEKRVPEKEREKRG